MLTTSQYKPPRIPTTAEKKRSAFLGERATSFIKGNAAQAELIAAEKAAQEAKKAAQEAKKAAQEAEKATKEAKDVEQVLKGDGNGVPTAAKVKAAMVLHTLTMAASQGSSDSEDSDSEDSDYELKGLKFSKA